MSGCWDNRKEFTKIPAGNKDFTMYLPPLILKLLVHDFFLRKARSLLKDCIFSSVQFLPEIPFHPLLKKKAFEILT